MVPVTITKLLTEVNIFVMVTGTVNKNKSLLFSHNNMEVCKKS
jgi:hypothetical protein